MMLQTTGASESPSPNVQKVSQADAALALCIQKTRRNIQRLADEPKACAWAADGNYFGSSGGFYDISNWTTSFFTGMALLSWRQTGDETFLKQVQRLASHYRLKVFEHDGDTMHDLGFLYSLYSVALYRLTGASAHCETALRAAEVLARRFEPKGRYLQAWGRMEDRQSPYAGLAIIDSMMNLPLLFWAAEEGHEARYRDIAVQHAETTLRHFVRPDGSVFHAYRFDGKSGEPMGPDNYCGWTVDSHWARGAAWAVYGFALSYGYVREPRFLQTALKLAHKFAASLDGDALPVWDFDLPPGERPLRDSSAGAIAVCGFHELLRYQPQETVLQAAAQALLDRLCSHECLDANAACPGLLRHAQVADGPGRAQNAYASWGDYFLMEALSRELTPGQTFW